MRLALIFAFCTFAACSGAAPAEDAAARPGDAEVEVSGPIAAPIYFSDASGLLGLPPLRVHGVAIVDYDGDDWPDLTLGALDGLRVFRNRGDGTFEDDGDRSGIRALHLDSASGVVFGDVDGDGDLDMFLTRREKTDMLLLNEGEGRFRDATAERGLLRVTTSEGASFGDLDGDGDLDLYVAIFRTSEGAPGQSGGPNVYWRNDGGTFTDATAEAGLGGLPTGETFGSVIFDADGDHDADVLVVHDISHDQLLMNDGEGHFVDGGDHWLFRTKTGLMGLDLGDADGDGDLDVYSTNFGRDMLLADRGETVIPRFQDVMDHLVGNGIEPSDNLTGWGCALADLDDDGDVDVISTSSYSDGLGYDVAIGLRPGQMVVLQSAGGGAWGSLSDVTAEAGPALQETLNGFGLSAGDFDRDGDLDALVGVDREVFNRGQPYSEPGLRKTVLLLRNDGALAQANASLQLRLRQPGTANVFSVGARVDVTSAAGRASRVVLAGSSYLSMHTDVLHFGLGTRGCAERALVTWPDGAQSEAGALCAGEHTITRPEGLSPPVEKRK